MLNLKRAVRASSHCYPQIVFVGAPTKVQNAFAQVAAKHKVSFCPSGHWKPSTMKVLRRKPPMMAVLYDAEVNHKARVQLQAENIPIVAFVNTESNIGGIEYPVPLFPRGMTYVGLWDTILSRFSKMRSEIE